MANMIPGPLPDSPIECSQLTKSFGPITVLNKIDLKVKAGSICAIIGPNGAGKTTLLKILAALVTPTEGTARICGEYVTRSPQTVKAHVGYVSSEERSFYWRLTGMQNLKFFAALHGLGNAEVEERAGFLLDRLGLVKADNKNFREYSTGAKQALSIVRGLLHNPPVILFDEPTRSLSYDITQNFYELIRSEADQGKAILFASHNFSEVEKMADTIVILHKGYVTAAGTLQELRKKAGLPDDAGFEKIFLFFIGEAFE